MLFNAGLANRIKTVLGSTYDSVVTVNRLTDGRTGNATTQTRPAVYTNTPCRRSKSHLSALNPTTGAATVNSVEVLFLGPEWNIKTGDELLVTGPIGAVNPGPDRYFAGKPIRYATHQEIKLEIRGRA